MRKGFSATEFVKRAIEFEKQKDLQEQSQTKTEEKKQNLLRSLLRSKRLSQKKYHSKPKK